MSDGNGDVVPWSQVLVGLILCTVVAYAIICSAVLVARWMWGGTETPVSVVLAVLLLTAALFGLSWFLWSLTRL